LLTEATRDELLDFIRVLAVAEPAIRNLVLASFAPKDKARETKGHYTRQIKSLLTQAAGRQRFITVTMAAKVNGAMRQYLETAEAQMRQGQYRSTFYIATAVLEEMTKALQFADDSYGYVGSAIHGALDLLELLVAQPLPEDMRKALLDYCCKANEKQLFDDWDWHLGILEIATPLLATDAEEARVLELLRKEEQSPYKHRQAQRIHYAILLQRHGEEAAWAFLEQHLDNIEMRELAVGLLIDRGDLDKAKTLAEEGLAAETRRRSGYRDLWLQWLLKIAQSQGDAKSIVAHARALYLNGFQHNPELFLVMRSAVAAPEWPAFLEKLIKNIPQANTNHHPAFLCSLLAAESRWEDLLAQLTHAPSLHLLEEFASFLMPAYQTELIELYAVCIRRILAHNVGRDMYQMCCRYLRKMRKMGGSDRVEELIQEFRQEYKVRRALMEELDKV
jgi:hypothetical protein